MKEIPNLPLLITLFNRHLEEIQTYCEAYFTSDSHSFKISIIIKEDVRRQIPALQWWSELHYTEKEKLGLNVTPYPSKNITLIPGDEVKFYYEKLGIAAQEITDSVYKIIELHNKILESNERTI